MCHYDIYSVINQHTDTHARYIMLFNLSIIMFRVEKPTSVHDRNNIVIYLHARR